MTSPYGYGYSGGGFGSGPEATGAREPGARRRKLAAMAGSMYRAGAAAAAEIKEQYNNTRVRGVETPDAHITIPDSFPNVAIVHKGDDQMVLFPSYAMRHVKQQQPPPSQQQQGSSEVHDEEYWRQEWSRLEDSKAIVDVDVRGWIYSPHKGPVTRRNRVLIGLARRLSGIPPPTIHDNNHQTLHEEHEALREEQKIAREAHEIERRGQGEKEVALRGGYSEAPKEDDDEDADAGGGFMHLFRSHSGKTSPMSSSPGSPTLGPRTGSWATQPGELTEAELAVANANLMARLGPFMTVPMVEQPVTLFFYNDTQSQSRTVVTNDSGHFVARAALDFVPTHVRVLANENLSATEPVQIIEPDGVSLISDIDDTIKRSSISMGAREIFRNTFIRELSDLAVDGVKEWYNKLHEMGVKIHYCSNSPWQLFPVLATFFYSAGLPPGSIHLKQYSGMLQGIFEPVAERKKGTLEKILRDFPERKFLLVGDSGEADLEVYTDLAAANPGRILAVFIRDVTTPEQARYFDSSFGAGPGRVERISRHAESSGDDTDNPTSRPALPPRGRTEPPRPEGPATGTLIDFSDEPAEMTPSDAQKLESVRSDGRATKPGASAVDLLARKAPPRPAKPMALRSAANEAGLGLPLRGAADAAHPLAQMQNSSDQTLGGSSANLPRDNGARETPPPPPPRRRTTPSSNLLSLSPRLLAQRLSRGLSYDGDPDADVEPLPGGVAHGYGGGASSPPVNKKLDLWRRRLERAHETLDAAGVALYTWRRGEDVVMEAEGIVRDALKAVGGREKKSLGRK